MVGGGIGGIGGVTERFGEAKKMVPTYRWHVGIILEKELRAPRVATSNFIRRCLSLCRQSRRRDKPVTGVSQVDERTAVNGNR